MSMYPHASLVQRYSRQMLVPQMNAMNGQIALQNSKVIVIGAGGIGSSVILYIAGAGVGTLSIVDFDCVEESNLHRQVIHDTEGAKNSINKAASAAARVNTLNPHIYCEYIQEKLDRTNAMSILSRMKYDTVVDATDNFEARYIINDACNQLGLALVSGSAVGMEGQITVFSPMSGFACYRCLYPNPSSAESCRSCDNAGVVGPVPGVIGTLQAIEVIKFLVKNKLSQEDSNQSSKLRVLIGRQLYFDATTSEFHEFGLPKRNPECMSCKHLYSALDSDKEESALKLFGEIIDSNASTNQANVPNLPKESRVSASEYFSTVLQSKVPHVLLDVRSIIQFNIVSLKYSFGFDDEDVPVYLLNVPYGELLKSSREVDQKSLNFLKEAIFSRSDVDPLPVYVICRRGIDSVRATHLLLSLDLLKTSSEVSHRILRVFNVEGGLNAWHFQVDSSFPHY